MDDLRVDVWKAHQVVNLLVEGVGIRAISRLTGLHQQTVLNVLEVVGEKCAHLLDRKLVNVEAQSVQADELWSFVNCKNANNKANDPDFGDQYTFLGIDRKTKLIISHFVGKRDYESALAFSADLRKRIKGRTQLTTDQLQAYVRAILNTFFSDVDFAQQQKIYENSAGDGSSNPTARRYSPPKCIMVKTMIHIGNPDPSLISTSHVERTNLSVRLFNRRFTRLTLGYSKKLANHKHSVALLIAHFNFCRVHSAHGLTPAHAAGITERPWTIADLITGI